jgi:hypothetical protein
MTGSKQSHLRYRVTRELCDLVGKLVIIQEAGKNNSKSGILDFSHNSFYGVNPGYYLDGVQIPARSVQSIQDNEVYAFCPSKIIVNPNYLSERKGVRA